MSKGGKHEGPRTMEAASDETRAMLIQWLYDVGEHNHSIRATMTKLRVCLHTIELELGCGGVPDLATVDEAYTHLSELSRRFGPVLISASRVLANVGGVVATLINTPKPPPPTSGGTTDGQDQTRFPQDPQAYPPAG